MTWAVIDAYTADWTHGIYGWLAAGIRHDHRTLRPREHAPRMYSA